MENLYANTELKGLKTNITKRLSLRARGRRLSSPIREFKQRFFNRRPSTGSGLFALLSHDFEQIVGQMVPIECFHMTSRRPYWCPKTMKRTGSRGVSCE